MAISKSSLLAWKRGLFRLIGMMLPTSLRLMVAGVMEPQVFQLAAVAVVAAARMQGSGIYLCISTPNKLWILLEIKQQPLTL
jgi:hypothetical protein